MAGGKYYGAITCERAADKPFIEKDIEFIRAVTGLVGPAMENKYANDLSLFAKIKIAGETQLKNLLGPSHLGKKLIVLTLAAFIGLLANNEGDYRLNADTKLEGAIRRAVVVPFDGYIDQAPAQAGDLVKQGQILCALDDKDLRLGKLAKYSKFRQLQRQYQEAVAKHDRAHSGIIKAQLEQSQAELDLLETRLLRTQLAAPFDGLLVSGDLSQRLGSAVEQGEVIFEVTPLDAYRIILKVEERRISDVQPGQKGTLVLSSLPNEQYHFTVTKITPITRAEEGRNYFRVEAQLTDIDEKLRPGMEGVGKIFIDRRLLVSIWTRDFQEWLKLSIWAWRP